MRQSESIENLAKALIGLQAQMPVVPYDAENPFFKSRYATLTSIWFVCRPLLAEHELAVIQLPVSTSFVDGNAVNAGLSTRLVHSSGEWIEDTFFIPLEAGPRAAQAAGSIITYLRRYSLAALLGVVTDEDSDGEPQGNNGQQPKTESRNKGKKMMAPQKFVEYCADELGYNDPEHVRATIRLLGIKNVPQSAESREILYKGLKAYRHLRDEKGLDQDNALAALQDQPG